MKYAVPDYVRALPAYLGGKRRLSQIVFALLSQTLPSACWSDCAFLDPFAGGGSIALAAKAVGFRVTASDVAERAVVTARAVIENSTVRLLREDVLDLFRGYGLQVEQSRAAGGLHSVFPHWQAAWFENAVVRARRRSEPVRSLLLLLVVKVLLRSLPMSVGRVTDAIHAATDDFDVLTSRRTAYYLRGRRLISPGRLWSIACDVNAGVIGGHGAARKADAIEILQASRADVVYLDPPFPGTANYRREYRLVDALLGDGMPEPEVVAALDTVLQAAERIPILILSYGGRGVSADGLRAAVARYRDISRIVAIPGGHLTPLRKEDDRAEEREFIVVATR